MPNWRAHFLSEPQERVRELVGDEGERLEEAARNDYLPLFQFARATGLRLSECVTLKWSEVDWSNRRIRKAGKGGRLVTTPITDAVRLILWPLRGHHPEFAFTYVAERTREGRVRGERYPLTVSGVKTAWRRLKRRAGVEGFRFHDYRHDVGTKLLRETGNLKLVQQRLEPRGPENDEALCARAGRRRRRRAQPAQEVPKSATKCHPEGELRYGRKRENARRTPGWGTRGPPGHFSSVTRSPLEVGFVVVDGRGSRGVQTKPRRSSAGLARRRAAHSHRHPTARRDRTRGRAA